MSHPERRLYVQNRNRSEPPHENREQPMTRAHVDRPLQQDLAEWDARRPRSLQAVRSIEAGELGIGPSDYLECRRKLQYKYAPPAGLVVDQVDKTAAIFGTLLDEGIKRALRRRYRSRYRHFGLKVDIPGLDRQGEVDDYAERLGRVRDYKTGGTWRWERWEQHGVPDDDPMWGQLLIYGLALTRIGKPVNYLELVCVERAGTTGVQPLVFRRDYVEADALAALSWLLDVASSIDAGIEQPRDRRGPGLDRLCELCEFARTCWDLDNVPAGRSPQAWLLVVDDADRAAALADYDRGRAIEKQGKEIKEDARARLEGIEPGRYGDFTVRFTGGNPSEPKPDYAADSAALRDRLEQVRKLLPSLRLVVDTVASDPLMHNVRDLEDLEQLVALISSEPVMPTSSGVTRTSIEVKPVAQSVRQAEAAALEAQPAAAG